VVELTRDIDLARAAERMAEALKAFIKDMHDLADSGDIGYFDPEQQDIVIKARAALAAYDKVVKRDG